MRLAIALLLAALAFGAAAGVEEDGDPILLVAKPSMPDPNFARTVVAVGFPQDSGPMGVVLNRPSPFTLGQLLGEEQRELAAVADAVYLGGPVQPDGILFVFRAPEHPIKALPFGDGTYLSGDREIFRRLLGDPATLPNRRFYAGYAGWAEGQLDQEVLRGDWYVLPLDAAALFAEDTDSLWDRLLERARSPSAQFRAPASGPLSFRPVFLPSIDHQKECSP